MTKIAKKKMAILITKLTSLCLLLLSLFTNANSDNDLSGTPGISGVYAGEYSIIMRAAPAGVILGYGISKPQWLWNFNDNTAIIQGTTLSVGFNYQLHDVDNLDPEGETLHFNDNGDGTYTLYYSLQIYHPGLGNPMANASTTFRITQNNKILDIVAIDVEGDLPDGIIGTQIPGVFPLTIEPDLHGSAFQLAADSNNDGLSDQQALLLGLSPTLYDSDGDGIDDIIELGSDSSQPIDQDNDSIIDALEYGNNATNGQIAHGLKLISNDILTLSSETGWFVTKLTTASMESPVNNTTNNDDIVNTDATLGAPGLNYKFGHIDFELSLGQDLQYAEMASITLEFSSKLPDKLVLYSLERTESGNAYSLLSEQSWQKLSDNSIVVTLYNDDARDLQSQNPDSLAGSIALAENSLGQISRTEQAGSIAWLLTLLLLCLTRETFHIKKT
ncbi:MAG: hypothetical protein GY787_25555 [Alteromonadales bacterium]|nr:hypothetical protein [Alteromonadales bacterium]